MSVETWYNLSNGKGEAAFLFNAILNAGAAELHAAYIEHE